MKKIITLIFLLCLHLENSYSQDVRLIVPESSIAAAIKTLLDARAVSFNSLTPAYGVENYNVRLMYNQTYPVTFQYLPGNRFRLTCGFVARANKRFSLGPFSLGFDINGEGPVTIEGDLRYEGGAAQITLIGRATAVVSISGAPGFLLNIIGANQFTVLLPELRLGTYTLMLPNVSTTYFTSSLPSLAISGSNLTLGLQSKIVVLKVDQLRQSGERLEGSQVGVWEGTTFVGYTVPRTFNFPRSSTQTLRAEQGLALSPTEKYNRWNNLTDVRNHQSFLMDGSLTRLNSNFERTDPTITIRNELIDAPAVNGGRVELKDPWLVDVTDSRFYEHPYGYRNLGMEAPFKSETSPFRPTLESKYKGVFLNENPRFEPGKPYYSVRVPIYQWIGNFYSQFEEWQATGATLREIYDLNVPGYSTRAVVFKSSDAKVTAKYSAITASLDAQIMSGWNLVSIPINIASTPASQIYPDAISYVFGFENGTYVPKSTLKSGEGYWVRFANAHTKNYSGQPMFSTTIPVKSGWNLVGSISIPISINKTRTEPEGKRISPFYKNSSGGYVVADTIKPGEGYWVKMQSDCNLLYNIAPPQQGPGYEDPIIADVLNNSDRFIVSDAEGNTQELYVYTGEANLEGLDLELPPPPPEGSIFNVRFATDRMIELYDETAEENNFIIEVNTENYPVTVEWEINSENGIEYTVGYSGGGYGKTNYRQLDEKNGKIILSTKGNGKVSLLTGKGKSRVIPTEYSLHQNRPNPFNPITQISYALPAAGHTTLKIYDVLGREVAVLVNEYKEAGVYEVVWDASAQPSGVYFYKLQSGNFIAVKKMLLVR